MWLSTISRNASLLNDQPLRTWLRSLLSSLRQLYREEQSTRIRRYAMWHTDALNLWIIRELLRLDDGTVDALESVLCCRCTRYGLYSGDSVDRRICIDASVYIVHIQNDDDRREYMDTEACELLYQQDM